MNERNVAGVNVGVEAQPARILHIARQTGAEANFGCIEGRSDHRRDRLLRPRACRFMPRIITGLRLNFHALACAGERSTHIDKTDFSPGVRRMLAAVGGETPFVPGRKQLKLLQT